MSDPYYKAEFGISRLIRYNGKRQNFFDGLHRLVLFTNAVLGSTAFVTVISNRPTISAWLTGIVAIASALDTVIGFSERSRKYQEQRARYYNLYCKLVAKGSGGFVESEFREKRLRIDRDGFPTKRVLDVISRNEEDIARGYSYNQTIYISPLQNALRHIYDLPSREWLTVEQHKLSRNMFTKLTRRKS